ncbi:hypothetical protein Tco_1286979 [Tanacetum coccineum]
MKTVFNQMETNVSKCSVDKKYFEIEKKELSLDNDRLLEHIIYQDVMNVVMHANDHHDNVLPMNNNSLVHDNYALDQLKYENDRLIELLISLDLVHTAANSLVAINDFKYMKQSFVGEYEENLKLQTELANKNDMIERLFTTNFQKDVPDLKIEAKNVSIVKLKEHIANLKGNNTVESIQNVHNSNVVTLKVYKLDLPPLFPCIENNMSAHVDYLKHTQENDDILHEIVEDARELRPLDSNLASACKFVTCIQELLVYVSATCPSTKHVSDKLVAITPMNMTRKVRFAEPCET